MKTLFFIPARGGSKGIPHKNIKELCGKPLIYYSIEVARQLADDADICVSTDDDEIIECVREIGLEVPFVRPDHLASETATTNDVNGFSMKMMTNMSIGMIAIASFTISTSIAIYWICNSGFTVVQNLLVKRGKKHA